MALPIILMIVAMDSYDISCVPDVQTSVLEAIAFTQRDAVAAVEAAEWSALLGQSHNDTIWPSGACVDVEPCHLLSDDIQAETYFK